MLRYIVKAVLLFLAFILQFTVADKLQIFGIAPSFVLVTVLVFTCLTTRLDAVGYGLCAGVMWDLMWCKTFGVVTLLMLGITIACYFLNQHIYKKNAVILAGYAFVFTALFEILYYILVFALWGGGAGWAFVLLRLVLPQCLYNAVLAVVLYPLLAKLDNILPDKGAWPL